MIVSTKAVARSLDQTTAPQLREEVHKSLNDTTPPPANLSIEERRVLKNLWCVNSIVILPADKGNTTVVMDREHYEYKKDDMLADSTYRKNSTRPNS